MSYITIKLILHNYTTLINRDNLISLFPQSLLAVTLEQDPSTDIIELSVPVVTPEILDIIKYVTDNKKSPVGINYNEALITAGDYLNMDYIQALSDPQYKIFREGLSLDLISIDKSSYESAMTCVINHDAYYIGRYISHTISPELTIDIDPVLFIKAIKTRRIWSVDLFLRRGLDPSYNNNHYLCQAIEIGNIDIVKKLLQNDRVNPQCCGKYSNALDKLMVSINKRIKLQLDVVWSGRGLQSIPNIIRRLYYDIFDLLLRDSRLNPSADNNRILHKMTISKLRSDLHERIYRPFINRLLEDERVNILYLQNL